MGAHWLFVATEAEIPEPGDYVTVDIGRYSVIIVRDDDEDGAGAATTSAATAAPGSSTSARARSATSSAATTSGPTPPTASLLHAGDQPAAFDQGCFGLKAVHVRVVAGLIFICLAADPPDDFDDVLAAITPYLAAARRCSAPRWPPRSTSSRRPTGSW